MTQKTRPAPQRPDPTLSAEAYVPADAETDDQPPASNGADSPHDIVTALWRARREAEQSGESHSDYPPGEVTARGEAIYRERILPQIEPPPKGTFVVIDIESGDYEIDERDVAATLRLFKRRPTAMTYAVRVGYRAPYRHTGIIPTPAQRA